LFDVSEVKNDADLRIRLRRLRGALRAHRDEPEPGDHVPEVRERETHDSAFGFCDAIERRQSFSRVFILGVCLFGRRMRVHAPWLRLPLVHGAFFPAV
jgi:hypothetical protein